MPPQTTQTCLNPKVNSEEVPEMLALSKFFQYARNSRSNVLRDKSHAFDLDANFAVV
jgi:hypothetical protein